MLAVITLPHGLARAMFGIAHTQRGGAAMEVRAGGNLLS
jgi:hypothetical protein